LNFLRDKNIIKFIKNNKIQNRKRLSQNNDQKESSIETHVAAIIGNKWINKEVNDTLNPKIMAAINCHTGSSIKLVRKSIEWLVALKLHEPDKPVNYQPGSACEQALDKGFIV